MSQPLMGPDVTCWLEASQSDILRVRDHFGLEAQLSESLNTKLMKTISACIDQFLEQSKVEHDGYFLTWELNGLLEMERDYMICASFNVSVKEEDFDLFDEYLNTDRFIKQILDLMESDIREYLRGVVEDYSALKTRMESDGFGYG